jgi:hypothetical protein
MANANQALPEAYAALPDYDLDDTYCTLRRARHLHPGRGAPASCAYDYRLLAVENRPPNGNSCIEGDVGRE